MDFLVSATRLLSASLDYEVTLNQVVNLAVPEYADYCVVELCDESGELQQIAVAHRDPSKIPLLRRLRETYPPKVYRTHASRDVMQTAESRLFAYITPKMLEEAGVDEEHRAILRELGPCSYVNSPIKLRDKVLGTLGFMYAESRRHYTKEDIQFTEEIGSRAAIAIENSRLYGELERARDEAEAGSRMKTAFLANMSHEIRTPLNAILGFGDMLGEPDITEENRTHYTKIIKRNGALLLRLIDDILDLSKVEAGRMAIIKTPVAVADLLEEVLTIFSAPTKSKGIELITRIASCVPKAILSDSMRLRQILLNIIGNAVKFTANGSVTIEVDYVSPFLKIKVIDTGRGMTPIEANRLFQPFTQGDESTTREFGGTGLGLVLSRRLCQALGGGLELENTERGVGSTFTVTIHALREEPLHAAKPTVRQGAIAMPRAARILPLAGKEILVVEDSPDNRLLISSLLKSKGAAVHMATNGNEAVDLAFNQHFDVILMDIQMPGLDGYQATALLREQGYAKPILALTAHALSYDEERSLKSGFDAHISKPIIIDRLLETVKSFVQA
jgi:signal transduction histidine kinase